MFVHVDRWVRTIETRIQDFCCNPGFLSAHPPESVRTQQWVSVSTERQLRQGDCALTAAGAADETGVVAEHRVSDSGHSR